MKSIEQQNKEIEEQAKKDTDHGIITDGLCDTPSAQKEFDKKQKGKMPLSE